MLHCSAEWNDDFVGQWIGIVANKEVFVWQIVNPLSQFNTSIECPCIICPAWSDDTEVDEAKVCIDNSLDIHTIALIVSTEVMCRVVDIFWFVNATEPTIDGTNTAMEYSKGSRLFIPFRGTPFELF